MKQTFLKIMQNEKIAADIYKIVLSGDVGAPSAGQFAEIAIGGFYLRRPFSLADFDENTITILYKAVGGGTEAMTRLTSGEKLDCLLPLGNGFDVGKAKSPLLIGGGIGVAPLYKLAAEFGSKGLKCKIVLGFKTKSEALYIDEFQKFGDVVITTDDGSAGYRGNVVDFLKTAATDFDYYYACGPSVMMKKLTQWSTEGELSLEARMGCGFGACMGCSVMTKNGAKRVCKEGPVFAAAEVIF